MTNNSQHDLPAAGEVFNLYGETGLDGARLAREQAEAEVRRREALAYASRMQRTFAECPGFLGCDAPTGPGVAGRVSVEPVRISEAMVWLKRRFHVSHDLALSTGNALVVEVLPRVRRARVGARRVAVHFGRPEQFTLPL